MKAVVYHADAEFAWGGQVGDLYKRLFERFRAQCHKHGMQLVHLTVEGHEGWGDENYNYPDLNPKHVVLNREECFTQFLETAPDNVYWFTEPDIEILKMWPALKADMCLMYRHGDAVSLCPAWRMATPKALPIFRRLRDTLRAIQVRPGVGFDWHGDSEVFTKLWKDMGRPTTGAEYLGVKLELRNYAHYIKGDPVFTRNHFGKAKNQLAERK